MQARTSTRDTPRTTTRRPTHAMQHAVTGLLGVLWLGISASAVGASDLLERFTGHYVASRVSESSLRVTPSASDIHLDVTPGDDGFVLRWQSLRELDNGVRHHYEVRFEKTRRAGIYLAAMRCDAFGQPRPLDPARGEPYLWAHLDDDELTLYAMSIADDGSHDLSLYRYRADGERLTLAYERVRNEQPLERVRAVLERSAAETAVTQGARQHRAPACG